MRKERDHNDPSPPFKEKEKGSELRSQAWWLMEGSMLGGQWKVTSLVANGRFQAWWPMEGSKLGGQWKVPSLVANGRVQAWWPMEDEGKTPFHLFPLSPNKLYLNLQFFPLTLRFYFTMILSLHSHLFFPFPRFINYNCCHNPTWRECEDEIHTPKIGI